MVDRLAKFLGGAIIPATNEKKAPYMRILLVEDEEKLSQTLAQNMRDEGFAVDTVLNGIEGMEMASQFSYDLMILDIMLPGMTGTQLLQKVRAQNKETPILMLTAMDSVQDKVKHFEAGAISWRNPVHRRDHSGGISQVDRKRSFIGASFPGCQGCATKRRRCSQSHHGD